MSGVSLTCPAKINLALHVGEVQSDGYHPVDTLCVFINAGDELHISFAEGKKSYLELVGSFAHSLSTVPAKDNFVLKAENLFSAHVPTRAHRFGLRKEVPAASGIGGGTSNGVTTLFLLNKLYGNPLSDFKLMTLSRELGADGAVCMARVLQPGHSFWATGIGDKVSIGPKLPPLYLCLVNPYEAVSTGRVFQMFDQSPAPHPFQLQRTSNLTGVSELCVYLSKTRNDLRDASSRLNGKISPLEQKMAAREGCLFSRMSGSGATVFGVFSSCVAAGRAARAFIGEKYWAIAGPILSSDGGV